MKISKDLPIGEIGAIVYSALKAAGIDAFLSGGAVVSIYSKNAYQSWDLDFVSNEDREKIKSVLTNLGFHQDAGRPFAHPDTSFTVEFPGQALMIGNSPIREFKELQLKSGILKLLTPTDCVKDRLASYYHWNDRQGLNQAVLVAKAQPVNLQSIEEWSRAEGAITKYADFIERLKS
jgi:hypothetical protein